MYSKYKNIFTNPQNYAFLQKVFFYACSILSCNNNEQLRET